MRVMLLQVRLRGAPHSTEMIYTVIIKKITYGSKVPRPWYALKALRTTRKTMTDTKKPVRLLRLKDSHPTHIKLMKLYDLAEELRIVLEFDGNVCTVSDRENGLEVEIEDIEGDHGGVSSFPHPTEFKLTYENPKYTEFKAKEQAEYWAKLQLEKETKAKLEAEKKQAEAEAAIRFKEEQERKTLADLKAKYET